MMDPVFRASGQRQRQGLTRPLNQLTARHKNANNSLDCRPPVLDPNQAIQFLFQERLVRAGVLNDRYSTRLVTHGPPPTRTHSPANARGRASEARQRQRHAIPENVASRGPVGDRVGEEQYDECHRGQDSLRPPGQPTYLGRPRVPNQVRRKTIAKRKPHSKRQVGGGGWSSQFTRKEGSERTAARDNDTLLFVETPTSSYTNPLPSPRPRCYRKEALWYIETGKCLPCRKGKGCMGFDLFIR